MLTGYLRTEKREAELHGFFPFVFSFSHEKDYRDYILSYLTPVIFFTTSSVNLGRKISCEIIFLSKFIHSTAVKSTHIFLFFQACWTRNWEKLVLISHVSCNKIFISCHP